MTGDGLTPRRVTDLLLQRAQVEAVIALHAPRSVGRSTVLRGFAQAAGTPIRIGEYQPVPEVLDAITARLDREGSLPGTAVITVPTRQRFLGGIMLTTGARSYTDEDRLHVVHVVPVVPANLLWTPVP